MRLLDRTGDPTGLVKGHSLTLGVVAPPGLDLSGPVLAATKVTASEKWEGEFPLENTKAEGTVFPPNGYGVQDMIGNVWE